MKPKTKKLNYIKKLTKELEDKNALLNEKIHNLQENMCARKTYADCLITQLWQLQTKRKLIR